MTTIEQVKNHLKKELAPINSKLENMLTTFDELKTSVKFVSEIQQSNEKLQQQKADISKDSFN